MIKEGKGRERAIHKEVWYCPTLFKLWKNPLETTEQKGAVTGWVVQLMTPEYLGGGKGRANIQMDVMASVFWKSYIYLLKNIIYSKGIFCLPKKKKKMLVLYFPMCLHHFLTESDTHQHPKHFWSSDMLYHNHTFLLDLLTIGCRNAFHCLACEGFGRPWQLQKRGLALPAG